MEEVKQNRMSMLVHPILIQTVTDTTFLIDDVVGIIGTYWLTLHTKDYGTPDYDYEEEDIYECLDGPKLEMKYRHDDQSRGCFMKDIYLSRYHLDKVMYRGLRIYCVLGTTEDHIFVLRILNRLPPDYDDVATWKSSTSLQNVLPHMPLAQYQQLIEINHLKQEIELQYIKIPVN